MDNERKFVVLTAPSFADPEHTYVAYEEKPNGDKVFYETFDELEEEIAATKAVRSYNEGYQAGAEGEYQNGFDKGVHRTLEILEISEEEFVNDQAGLKEGVTFYRGLLKLGLDVNKLKFYEETEEVVEEEYDEDEGMDAPYPEREIEANYPKPAPRDAQREYRELVERLNRVGLVAPGSSLYEL